MYYLGMKDAYSYAKNVAKLVSFGKWKTLVLAFLEIQNDAKVHFLEYFEAWLQLWPSANMKTRPLKNKQKFLKAKFPKLSRIKSLDKWYFVTEIVLNYCEKKMF